MLEFAITFKPDMPHERIVALTRQAEGAGFEYGWIFDSHVLWQEPYPLLTLMAVNTERMRLGTCVTNPAVRDATGIVTFNQFVNQLDYADVNNALNDRVLAVLAGVKLAPGATLSFMGVLTRGSGPPEVTPVRLRERPARACRPGLRPGTVAADRSIAQAIDYRLSTT